MSEMGVEPKVGVGVIVRRSGRVLLGRRRGTHGAGTWQFPGGHLKYGESVEDCARRELLEETGLVLGEVRLGPFTNDIFTEENCHYITLYAIGDSWDGDAELKEPEKCEKWEWREWADLPQPYFPPMANLLDQGFDPWSSG